MNDFLAVAIENIKGVREEIADVTDRLTPRCYECGAPFGFNAVSGMRDPFNICPPCRAEYRRGER